MILSDNSEFDSKPELEIYADDVKCSHGSTSGNVDQDAIHYLMTRGLDKKESTKPLINNKGLNSKPDILFDLFKDFSKRKTKFKKIKKEDYMTETLAELYIEQKKFKEALKAYEILSLKYPEKISLFADQIIFLKKKLNNV